MVTTAETILEALKAALATGLDATVERNISFPEEIPATGLVIIRDGDPGEPTQTLGGFRPQYYQHTPEIEIYVADANQATRDQLFSEVVAGIGLVFEADLTLGGLIAGMTYGPPVPSTEPVDGGEDIKAGTIFPVLDYETTSPLA